MASRAPASCQLAGRSLSPAVASPLTVDSCGVISLSKSPYGGRDHCTEKHVKIPFLGFNRLSDKNQYNPFLGLNRPADKHFKHQLFRPGGLGISTAFFSRRPYTPLLNFLLFSPDCFCSQAHHEWRGANFLRDVGDVAKLLRYA